MPETPRRLRVVKLGGSLLESRDWQARLVNWIETLPTARTLLLVGGGPPVDAIRSMAELYHYEQEFLHWLCIDAMDISFRMAQQQLGIAWLPLRTADALRDWSTRVESALGLVHVSSFYTIANHRDLPVLLPLDWSTTSDSLAALLARIVGADELILLKSCPLDASLDWSALVRAGIVDQAFPEVASGIPRVAFVSL